MWHMILVLIRAGVKVSHRVIIWAPFQKEAYAKMLARDHNSLQPLHAFNSQESAVNNARLIRWFKPGTGWCAGYALHTSRIGAILFISSLKTMIVQQQFHILEYHYILSNLNKKTVKWCKIKHNLHKLKYDHTCCWMVNCMVEKTPKGNKTCVNM